MGKPLSRPDCLRQSPRCLGKGDEEEAYIEDCYVPQRSIYDTMRINEQIDQGAKLCQPSRSTLGSGGEVRGEGSTLSSNGTIGADMVGVFVSRNTDSGGGVKRLDERVIFDALKLTGDPQIMSPPIGIVGSGLPNATSSSGSSGVAAVAKRRHQGSDKKDNPNRRSWKAFLPPSYPEFAERLEFSPAEGAEKRSSGAGGSLSPLPPAQPIHPSTPTSSTPSLPPYTPSPLSSAPHTPPVTSSPSLTPAVSPVPPLQRPPLCKQKQGHPVMQKQFKETRMVSSPSREHSPASTQTQAPLISVKSTQHSPSASTQVERKAVEQSQSQAPSSKAGIMQIPEEPVESVKTSDSESDSPLLDQDQGDSTPLIPPKPVFCPPTKARTWPRSVTTGKRTQVGLRHNFPLLPPLPPLLCEEGDAGEESLYLLDPPSPFLKEEEELVYGGLPLSPCVSQEGGDEGLLAWGAQGGDLRERTASEIKFEEDERRILEELEDEEQEECSETEEEVMWKTEREKAEEERALREEREWEAVLKIDNREIIDQSWDRETLESEGWHLTGSSGQWPVLTPPVGFGATSASPCPSSGAESDDLFLELERQCEEDEGQEGAEMSVDPDPLDPYVLPCLEEEEREEDTRLVFEGTPDGTPDADAVMSEPGLGNTTRDSGVNASEHKEQIRNFERMRTQDCEKEHGLIDEDFDCCKRDGDEEEEMSYPTDSALGHQLESDSSGALVSQPDGTGGSDVAHGPSQPEMDVDSGASSEHDDEGCEERVTSSPLSPRNPYAEALEPVEEETEVDEGDLKESETDWDVYEQSEAGLDCSEDLLMEHSHESLIGNECTQDVDVQTFCSGDLVPSETSKADKAEKTSLESETNVVDVTDEASGLEMSGQDPVLQSLAGVPCSTPKPASPADVERSTAPSFLPQSPCKPDVCAAGSDGNVSEAFVVSDSFVYLAVSATPQSPIDCPPSPLGDSVPPSPVPKPPCCPDPEEDEDGALLSPDSFVYMAAPERHRPGPCDVSSACGDVQELDLDSYSEGTQSGMDGVEFVLGSVTGDSDWESDGSALDFPSLVSRDQPWDQLEPGLLQNLFKHTEESQAEDCKRDIDGHAQSVQSSEPTVVVSSNSEPQPEVGLHLIEHVFALVLRSRNH